MMQTLSETKTTTEDTTETFTLLVHNGEFFIQNVIGSGRCAPSQMMQIEPDALRPLGEAMIAAADARVRLVEAFRPKLVPGAPRTYVAALKATCAQFDDVDTGAE